MKPSFPKSDLVAATIVLIAAAGELLIREMYYRLSAEVPRLLMVASVWIVLLPAAAIATRRGSARTAKAIGRGAVFVGLAVWLDVVGSAAASPASPPSCSWRASRLWQVSEHKRSHGRNDVRLRRSHRTRAQGL